MEYICTIIMKFTPKWFVHAMLLWNYTNYSPMAYTSLRTFQNIGCRRSENVEEGEMNEWMMLRTYCQQKKGTPCIQELFSTHNPIYSSWSWCSFLFTYEWTIFCAISAHFKFEFRDKAKLLKSVIFRPSQKLWFYHSKQYNDFRIYFNKRLKNYSTYCWV